MPSSPSRAGLFPALLKHWRHRRGLSQLDLALAADVSSRHVSFLETGRSSPSEAMVLRLAATLDVPLRHADAMLEAAGHEARYARGDRATIPTGVERPLALMKAHHEPYPLLVLDRLYEVLDANAGAARLFAALVPGVESLEGVNLARLTFAVGGELIQNFDAPGRELLWRLQREVLADPDDGPLAALLDEVRAMPTVAPGWREADLAVPSSPVLTLHLRAGERVLRFVTMLTCFQAPQSVALDELRIETWFPADDATAAWFDASGADAG